MTTQEFIREKITERTAATKVVSEEFSVNGVTVAAPPEHISLTSGIEKLADIFAENISEIDITEGKCRYLRKSITINGVEIRQDTFCGIAGGNTDNV